MKISININCDNAAFDDDLRGELFRILSDCADKVIVQLDKAPCQLGVKVLHDGSGNVVGKLEVDDSDATDQPHNHYMGVKCSCCSEIFPEDNMVGSLCVECHGKLHCMDTKCARCGKITCEGNMVGDICAACSYSGFGHP